MIYLDYNATTPVRQEVLDTMMAYFTAEWGNPSSTYRFGARLRAAIEESRANVAELVGAHASEIVFTSCGTESNNAAIYAALQANRDKRHVITSAVEHSSVRNYFLELENEGYRVTYLDVDSEGLLNLGELKDSIRTDTAVVSLMWANNETGVLFPVEEIAEICESRGVLFHCDGVQAAGKVEIDLRKIPIDYLSLTGHKLYAPKGIGALFVRKKSPFSPLIRGGNQERGLRAGTENVALIVGMGEAARLAKKQLPNYAKKISLLRDQLEQQILSSIVNTELNGHKTLRLPNTTNISFHGVESEALLILLDREDICASSGSACLAGSSEPSHVVRAMKPKSTTGRHMIRFSLGLPFGNDEVNIVVRAVQNAVGVLRG